jgi:hypothetical protein
MEYYHSLYAGVEPTSIEQVPDRDTLTTDWKCDRREI